MSAVVSRRTARVRYYALDECGKMVLTRIEKTAIPVDPAFVHLVKPNNNPIVDTVLWIGLYGMAIIGVIVCIFGAFDGSLFSPTQFIIFIKEKEQFLIGKSQTILNNLYDLCGLAKDTVSD